MKWKHFLHSLIIAAMLFSCAAKAPEITENAVNIKEIVNDPQTVLVDVRIPAQYSEKTATGAINIPLATIEENIEFFKKQKNVVLFCNRGVQSKKALEILRKNGVENIYFGKTLENVKALQNEKTKD